MSSDGALIPRFRRARRDPELAVLEGFHALKHALRFDAPLLEVVVSEEAPLERLSSALAPDLSARLHELARPVAPSVFAQLAPLPPPTGVIALAERRAGEPAAMLADPRAAPVILLEDPRDLGNMGACVRVAAAADAAGVLSTGSHDPWHPDALRGAAGLHYALPVARLERLSQLAGRAGPDPGAADAPQPDPPAAAASALGRPLLAIDPAGEPLRPGGLPPRAVLAFGTERYGLSEELSARAEASVSIPMRPGVSSLNLATSVAAVLFAWRLSTPPGGSA
ncbi:MAG TPA: TrmH family RNA methyltransferase [Solirubrobacteraceae bacterium]|jgi:TrmH family RNA methyltransferase